MEKKIKKEKAVFQGIRKTHFERQKKWLRKNKQNLQAADNALQLTLVTDSSYSFKFLFLHFWKEA